MTSLAQTAAQHPVARRRALRAIALFEAAKGVLALAGSIGLLSLLHHDLRHLALEMIGLFPFVLPQHEQGMLLHYADLLNHMNPSTLIALTVAYVSIRALEAFGLWRDYAWAEWLGALSGGIYIPLELSHLLRDPGIINAAVLLINVLIVAFLGAQLWLRRRAAMAAA